MSLFELHRTDHPTPEVERAAIVADPVFGKFYADHMAVADYTEGLGWRGARIIPTGQWQLHPAAAVFHYGQEIFEGLKAYRHADSSVWLFRPERNARRFISSAERLEMAPFPEELFLASLDELVALEQAWVPQPDGERSLYLRPFEIADEPYLGVREAKNYRYGLLACQHYLKSKTDVPDDNYERLAASLPVNDHIAALITERLRTLPTDHPKHEDIAELAEYYRQKSRIYRVLRGKSQRLASRFQQRRLLTMDF